MPIIYTYPAKDTPVGSDLIVISDSEASNITKRATLSTAVTNNQIKYDLNATQDGLNVDLNLTSSDASDNSVVQFTAGTNVSLTRNSASEITISASGGGNLPIEDEGVQITGAAAKINFTGAGVTASATGNDVTVDIPGGGGGYVLPLAANGTRGGIQIGYVQNAKNYPVVLSSEKAYVNVPWIDTNTTDITLTTTGTSGAATWDGTTLNIPQYSSGGGSGVSSFTNANGTYISAGTVNTNATGAVTVGTIDLSAVDGTAVAGTRFLSKDNTWDVPAYTTYNAAASATLGLIKLASDTEQSVAANAVTAETSRTYGIQFNADDQAVVNVPWTDTNTTSITLTTTGSSGAATWNGTTLNIPQYATTPAGSNTQIQYNNIGSFGATDLFTYSSRILSVGKVGDSSRSHLKVFGGGTEDSYLTLYCSAGTHGVTIEGPDHTGGSNYTLKLPASLPSVANQVLESNASGTLSWIPTPSGGGGSSSKLGFTPLSIYGATHEISSGQAGKTIYRQSVVETDCVIDKVDFFVTAVSGTCTLTVAVYVGNLTSATRVLLGTSGALTTGVNTITFASSYTFSAGDDIVIYTSQSAGEEISNSIAGDSGLLNNSLLSRRSASYSSTPPTSISPPETSGGEGLALHFYDE